MPSAESIAIELAYGTAERQVLIEYRVPDGTTMGEAIDLSGIAETIAEIDFATLEAGIWGKPFNRSHCVVAGDRIELYRPLQIDPRDARRELAAAGMSMGTKSSVRSLEP
jgi:putative ubiquitin-RnfH superfamily antitoxin RatB of RatAB toxin-antitoxin module